jgi:hypothetical protein
MKTRARERCLTFQRGKKVEEKLCHRFLRVHLPQVGALRISSAAATIKQEYQGPARRRAFQSEQIGIFSIKSAAATAYSAKLEQQGKPEESFRDAAAVVGIGAGREQHGGHGIG